LVPVVGKQVLQSSREAGHP